MKRKLVSIALGLTPFALYGLSFFIGGEMTMRFVALTGIGLLLGGFCYTCPLWGD